MERKHLVTEPQQDCELVDSGNEEKLERFGSFVLQRPDPQALWKKTTPSDVWGGANAQYERGEGRGGKWRKGAEVPNEWQIGFGGMQFLIRPTSFKHTGLFPEQLPNWEWIQQTLSQKKSAQKPTVLNLFGYTGGATLAAAKAGAEVTHVDASKVAVAWARQNAEVSGLADAPIRWIIEDVLVYVKREISRGVRYDAIIMDPPAFGHGPKDELWKIEEHLIELMELCKQLLSDTPLFVLMNGYAAGYSSLAFAYNLENLTKDLGGAIEHGDLHIKEKEGERLLPSGIYARWSI